MSGAAAVSDPLLGTRLVDRYELVQRIGDGGMGVVYRARDLAQGGTMVAVKVLADHLTRDPSWIKRFENEVAAVHQLTHPSTVRLLDHGTTGQGRRFMVMELLTGRSLREVMDREGPLTPERVLRLIMETCPPLAEAHACGIFHRDLKPDNLFVQPGERVKVLDFSVAKLRQPENGLQTAAGVIFGTPHYMSPEQGRGFPVDARSDLYSLGVIAFEMLVGRVPFNAHDPMDVLAMQVRAPLPTMPHVPEAIVQIVARCMAKDPSARFQDADHLAVACRTALRQLVQPGVTGPRATVTSAPAPGEPAPPQPSAASVATAPSVAGVPAAAAVAAAPSVASVPGGDGASVAFWALCLGGGVAAGLAAYWLYTAVLGW